MALKSLPDRNLCSLVANLHDVYAGRQAEDTDLFAVLRCDGLDERTAHGVEANGATGCSFNAELVVDDEDLYILAPNGGDARCIVLEVEGLGVCPAEGDTHLRIGLQVDGQLVVREGIEPALPNLGRAASKASVVMV